MRHLSFHSSDGHGPSTLALMHSFAIFVLKKVSHEMLCLWRLISSHLTIHMNFDNSVFFSPFFGWRSRVMGGCFFINI